MSEQQGDFEFFSGREENRNTVPASDIDREIENGTININAMSSIDVQEEDGEKRAANDADIIASGGASYGEVLRRLRESRGKSIEELAAETCIKSDALQALENEDTAALPPPFYIAAYIKKLCALYGVSDELTEELSADVKSTLERTVPEDLSRVVRGHGVSEENEKRIRRLAIILVALAVAAAVLIISGGALLVSHLISTGNGKDRVINVTYDEDVLLKLQGKPKLDIPRVPAK